MNTLGINAAYHDSSACLVRDGAIIAAAEEERFTGVKHAKRPVPFSAWELPFHAIEYCLEEGGIGIGDLDHVAYSFDPFLFPGGSAASSIELPLLPSEQEPAPRGASVWDPLFLSYIMNAPRQFAGGVPHHLRKRLRASSSRYRWHFVEHHQAHAASAFLASPFSEAAIMTIDGRGEQATTAFGRGKGASFEILGSVSMPHSLGLVYEKITEFLGFLHSSDEYKVMALASFGKPVYLKTFREIVRSDGNGSYRTADADWSKRLGPPRSPDSPLEQRHFDIAASLQTVLEETVLDLARWLHAETSLDSLCMAGGVALNCVMNSALQERGPFNKIWIQPAAGDAGTAIGAALSVDLLERPGATRGSPMNHVYLGPGYRDDQIELFLRRAKLPVHRMNNRGSEVADLLAKNAVVGWFQGRMEFGPRALGARSILASPKNPKMQAVLNEIKDREDFRPVAPVVLAGEASEWFESAGESPFMLFVQKVRPGKRPIIPAVCHVDGTARIQTVTETQNPLLHDLIQSFARRTGIPLLVNTSFNTRGKPIVCSPGDAVECFYTSPLDALALGSYLLVKPGVR